MPLQLSRTEHPSRKREDRVRVPEEARGRSRPPQGRRCDDAPVAQRQRQRTQNASSPGSNPGRGTTFPVGVIGSTTDFGSASPGSTPGPGADNTNPDARWSRWHGHRALTAETEVRTLDGQQSPCGGTGRRTRLKPARPHRACRFNSCQGHTNLEGWPSQERHRAANP